MKVPFLLAALAVVPSTLLGAEPLVEYPYVSIYYSAPTVSPGEKVVLPIFITDWNNSLVRFCDSSKRFDAMLKFGPVGGPYQTLVKRNLRSGDHSFSFGPFNRGDYECFVWTKDLANGLESHRVLHEFRVRTKDELAIPESKTRRATADDLAKHGVVPESGLYARVFVETPDSKTKLAVTNLPPNVKVPENGYVVLVPSAGGKVRHDTWKTKCVIYGPKWDAAKVAATAAANTAGLQKLINETAASGCRKLVLPKGLYRVAHEPTITVPTRFTLDLGGATLKLNGFTGHGCWVVRLDDTDDSHLVNGTIEGDYYEHDYRNSKHGSEWVHGVGIAGDCRYSSIENMTITHITGYGSTVSASGAPSYSGCKAGVGMMGKPTPGALDLATGEVKPVAGSFTGALVDLASFGTNHLLCVTHRLDAIRGLVSRSWYSRIAFYGADKKFISGEVAFLYRPLLIPPKAKFARVSIECETREKARACDLSLQRFRLPTLCAVRKNRFHLNRSTAHTPFVCRELLCADNVFDHCGETLTHCAIDAEDGWEGLHDYYLMSNRFSNTPNADVILNAGQNLVVDGNVGSVTIRNRVVSPCVRNNTLCYARFSGGGVEKKLRPGHEHAMHARFENNVYKGPLFLGEEPVSDGWTVALSGEVGRPEGKPTPVRIGPAGRIHHSKFVNCHFNGSIRGEDSTFDRCSFTYNGSRGYWKNCVINGSTFLWSTSNRFDRCELNGSVFHCIGNGYIGLFGCKLRNTTSHFQYWQPPTTIQMSGCDVQGTNSLWNVGRYTLGRFTFRDTTFDLGKDAVVSVCDARRGKGDSAESSPAITLAENCTLMSPLYVQTSRSECTSERPTVFAINKCKYPKTFPIGRQAVPQKNWKDLRDAEWTAYRKNLP